MSYISNQEIRSGAACSLEIYVFAESMDSMLAVDEVMNCF